MLALLFWASALALLHTYILYPLILVAWGALRGAKADLRFLVDGKDRRLPAEPPSLPRVSLACAAWNEEEVIQQKIDNSLALDYPPDRLEIVIGSDGSDDGTDAIVSACTDPRVRLSSDTIRVGKIGVLNRVVPTLRGEILVLTDANTIFEPSALRKLVRHFDDPRVGLVCGKLRLYNPKKKGFEESGYWTYESFLKLHEGKYGAVMGANGGIYAIRRELFQPLPPDTVVEDFVVAARVLLAGKRVVYDPEAVAWEETTEDYARERVRRVRIAAGNFQALGLVGGLLDPRRGFPAFAFFSHKLLRWLAPWFLLTALLTSLALASRGIYAAAFLGQLGFYGLAALGWTGWGKGRLGSAASIARYFVEMNVAMGQGLLRHLRGTQKVTWQRTARAG